MNLDMIEHGKNVYLSPEAVICRPSGSRLGSHIAIDSGFYCTPVLLVGDYVHISPHVAVIGGATARLIVGNFCFISVGCKIVCASDEFGGEGLVGCPGVIPERFKAPLIGGTVTFEDFSGLGANCTVMPGVRMAEGSVAGACSLITKDTEPWTIYVGTPARPVKKRRKDIILKYASELGYGPYPSV